jgi:large subunit ribosomal protein L22
MSIGYGYNPKDKQIARALLRGVNASYKDLAEVCRNVRGKDTQDAIEFLNLALQKKKAIYFARHNKRKGHRKELGGKKGGWPIKSIKIVLELIKNASANATKLGLSETKIAHISANKYQIYPRLSPKGRRIRHDLETAILQVVLEEKQMSASSLDSASKKAQEIQNKETESVQMQKVDTKKEEKKEEAIVKQKSPNKKTTKKEKSEVETKNEKSESEKEIKS